MYYKFLVMVVFPLLLGWGLYDCPPVQIFMELETGNNTLVQIISCYPSEDAFGKVRVQLNTPNGTAYYECVLTEEIYIRPVPPPLNNKSEHA